MSCVLFFIKDYSNLKFRRSLYHYQRNYQVSLHRFLRQEKNEYKFANLQFSIQREITDVLHIIDTRGIEIHK